MSFSQQALTKKLASLLETQDSITTISQWILFHHRHAQDIAEVWADYLLQLDSHPGQSTKKLLLLYLCNDVVQQARHKRKTEFIRGFASVLPKVFKSSYETVNELVRPKMARLINVWQQRNVFTADEIKALNASILGKSNLKNEKNGSNESKTVVASELEHLNRSYLQISSLNDANQGNLEQITTQERQYLPSDPLQSDNLPLPKIYLLKLAILDKLCNLAMKNISNIKNDRKQLILQIELLLKLAKGALDVDDSKQKVIERVKLRLDETRSELQEILGETESQGTTNNSTKVPIESKPTMTLIPPTTDSDDEIPTYAPDSDDDGEVDVDDEVEATTVSLKRQRSSRTPLFLLGASTPLKRVAFLEDVQVKEYEREEQTEMIHVVKSSDDDDGGASDDDVYSPDDNDYDPGEEFDAVDYEQHHKDVLELKREEEPEKSAADVQNDVLSILSKLA